jgi:outer membrane protein assembly factor BamB
VYALNAATGTRLWSYTTGGPVLSSPAVANGIVYVGSYDGKVYALNGSRLWASTVGKKVGSSPTVANGVSAHRMSRSVFGGCRGRRSSKFAVGDHGLSRWVE